MTLSQDLWSLSLVECRVQHANIQVVTDFLLVCLLLYSCFVFVLRLPCCFWIFVRCLSYYDLFLQEYGRRLAWQISYSLTDVLICEMLVDLVVVDSTNNVKNDRHATFFFCCNLFLVNVLKIILYQFHFFSIIHEDSRVTKQQGKGEADSNSSLPFLPTSRTFRH